MAGMGVEAAAKSARRILPRASRWWTITMNPVSSTSGKMKHDMGGLDASQASP
jgi:hypothetical protein